MSIYFGLPFLRATFFILGVTLLGFSLAACTATPNTPTVLSEVVGEAQAGKYKVEMVFQTAPMTGANKLIVKVNDVMTGELLRNSDVHLKIEKQTHIDSPSKEHDVPNIATDHEPTKMDPKRGIENQTSAKTNDGHPADTEHRETILTASSVEGEYVGQVNFTEAGEWLVTVNFEMAGREQVAAFLVTAHSDWGKFAVLSGFFGLNGALVIIAAVTKSHYVKSTKKKETRA